MHEIKWKECYARQLKPGGIYHINPIVLTYGDLCNDECAAPLYIDFAELVNFFCREHKISKEFITESGITKKTIVEEPISSSSLFNMFFQTNFGIIEKDFDDVLVFLSMFDFNLVKHYKETEFQGMKLFEEIIKEEPLLCFYNLSTRRKFFLCTNTLIDEFEAENKTGFFIKPELFLLP